MNKRIRELAEQNFYYGDWEGDGIFTGQVDLEQFAKSIVKECVKRLRFEGELGKIQAIAGPSGTYKIAFMNQAANILKEHFGVEE